MQIKSVQVCCYNEVIAELKDDHGLGPRWYAQVRRGPGVWDDELIDNLEEIQQLERVISGDTTGYMVFRAKEYEDVVVCVNL